MGLVVRVLWLDEIREGDGPRVGHKALGLARLKRLGFPVPDGFVLPAGPGVLGPDGASVLLEAYSRLGGSVAVRSSSSAEDLEGASFAGQYRTVLDVRGGEAVLDAARVCLALPGAAAEYARAVAAPAAVDMALLVQRFVEPRCAGVVFTRHPGDAGALLVEAHEGRGEDLVSGRVSPARYVVDRGTSAVRGSPRNGPLDPETLARLVSLARRAEETVGTPLDVEWAVGDDGPVLLQARPITVESEGLPPGATRLTRANVGEVLPDPVTPLTESTVVAFLEHGFRGVAAEAGLLPPRPGNFLMVYRRRLYLNLTQSAEVASRLPGVSRQDAERLVLGEGAGHAGAPRLGPRALARLVGVAIRLLGMARRLPAEVAAAESLVRSLPGWAAIRAADRPGLVGLLRAFQEAGRTVGRTHVATSGSSAVRLALLARVLRAVSPGNSDERATRLVSGLDDVASVLPTLALEALAAEARARPSWAVWLGTGPSSLEGAPPELLARLVSFLGTHGHRALSEGELRSVTWAEAPGPVLSALGTLASSPRNPGLGVRASAELRRADEEALLSRLGPLRRALVLWCLEGARRWVRERERTKATAVELVAHGRHLIGSAARVLVAERALSSEDDVYFLTIDEVVAALLGGAVPGGRLARRRRRQATEGVLPAPREVDLGGPEAAPEGNGPLRGLGVSGGTGAGRARVLDGSAPPRIERGEVLVARVLDAALGPLLASASAAVAEIGGMLSHGSVVARELGTPCVVDVRDATRRIVTGQLVCVDGSLGTVEVVEPQPTGAQGAPSAGLLRPVDVAVEEVFHALEPDPLARESVYAQFQDPETGLALVTSLGVRTGGRGEAVLGLALPDGRTLFGFDLEPARVTARELRVGGLTASVSDLVFEGALAPHESEDFPPGLVALLGAPRTVSVSLRAAFRPTHPAVDITGSLREELLEQVRPLGLHHVDQPGVFEGTLVVDGRPFPLRATGSRDHSWGLRDWEAADHWRLFAVQLGEGIALHALSLCVRGRLVEGGVLFRDGRAERVVRVQSARRGADFDLEVSTAAGPPLLLRGHIWRTVSIPVQVERRPARLLAGRPYRLILHENFTRFECGGLVGHGMTESTERPS